MTERLARQVSVLIVDDDRVNRDLLEIMLTPLQLCTSSAVNGEEALALVAKEPPDLILLDLMMPGMDGYQVASRLKGDAATKHIPIIIITAIDDHDSRLLALRSGAEEVLSKPVDRAELCERARNLLRLKANADEHDRYGRLLEREVGAQRSNLVESEFRFRQLAESIDAVFFLCDPRCTEMLYVSPAYEVIFGRSCADLYAAPLSWQDTIHPEDRKRVVGEMMPGGIMGAFDLEYRLIRPDGTERLVRSRTFPTRDKAGEVHRFAGLVDDITVRRKLERELRQSSKMDAIGRLAAGVAHDFNNLLSVILSYSEFMSEDLNPADPMRADAQAIHDAGLRAVELTRQLLAFSRQQVLAPTISDLNEIVESMQGMLRRLIGADIELVVNCRGALAKVLVDHSQMEQVLMNLAVNARDAMQPGGKGSRLTIGTAELVVDATTAAEHPGVKPGRYVVLSVADTGEGMDKATQARVFEPFFTTKGVGKGTGLGLATVFGIVEQSGGTIALSSVLGAGSTFTMYFPAVHGVARSRNPTNRVVTHSLRGSETVLIVDDDERVRQLACTILRKHGYDVLEANSGGDALLVCEQHPTTIDLLVTDIVMPRLNGRQLAARMQAIRPAMKVLYMSGYNDDGVLQQGTIDATIAFIQKPITPEPFAVKVRQTLDSSALHT